MLARALTLSLVLATLAPEALAQDAPAPLTAQQDHQRLMDLLGITALRPGARQDGTGPNAVNYDESKANPWPSLPDPLTLNNGKPVTSAKIWQTQRRPELVEIFDREILGRVPANVPGAHWQVVSTDRGVDGVATPTVPAPPEKAAISIAEPIGPPAPGIPTLTKYLVGHVDNSAYPAVSVDIEADLTLPANIKTPVPVVIELTFEKYPRPANRPPNGNQPPAPPEPHPTWKEQILARGWGYALLYPTTVQPDNGASLVQGIIGLTSHGQPRKPDDWGVLRAWAWGASRLLDDFVADPAVDARHVALEGHSRFGKAALVAMAYDPRFAVAFVNSSGAGGASLARRRFGEQLENIAGTGEYHWMAGNYLKYAALTPKEVTPADMPVDMHELIALCAPRPVFIGGGTRAGGDGWADVPGTFLAEAAAVPVYTLLGKQGLIDDHGAPVTTIPPVGTAVIAGSLGFRQHPGGHTPLPDYPTFLTFAAKYMRPSPLQALAPAANSSCEQTAPGIYKIGAGVTVPKLIQPVDPPAMINDERVNLRYTAASMTIDANGIPRDIKVRESRVGAAHIEVRPGSPAVDKSIIEAWGHFRFSPATCHGEAVAVKLNVESNWMLF